MLAIFLQTLPFFALVAIGWGAARSGLFPDEANAWLTRFVFQFALSALLFRFAVSLPPSEVFRPALIGAYLSGSALVWAIGMAVARARRLPAAEAAMEAHTAMTGNTGFLGLPMLGVILGPAATAPILTILVLDLIVFSSLVTVLVTAASHGRVSLALVAALARGLARNPMIVSMLAGLGWSALSLPLPAFAGSTLAMLGNAATPCALFAIGASLASRSAADRLAPAAWLSFAKLILHPAAVAVTGLLIFPVDRFAAGVMIAAAALPVAGNVYMLAHHFGIARQRVSAAILVSTAASIVTVPLIIAWARP